MKLSVVSTLSIAMLAFAFSGCSTAVKTNTNAAANTATNANKAENKPAENKAAANAPDASSGNVIKIDEAGIMMTVPKGMSFSKDGEDTIVKTEDDGVDTRFTIPKGEDYDKVIEGAMAEIEEYVSDIKVTENGVKSSQNSMDVTSFAGTGKAENGEKVSWQLAIIDAPKKPVVALTYAEESSLKKHAADLKAFFESIKKQ